MTDVGSLGDTVRELDAGAVVPPEDPGALADACVAPAAGPARDWHGAAREQLSWERAAEAHEAVYAELVAERA